MSLRPDLLPKQLCDELSQLTNQVPAVSFGEIKEIIKNEFGRPVSKVFSKFEEEPLAAASLAQVYKATLPYGTVVAVKVKRPGIDKLIEKDIHIMFFLAGIIEERIPEWAVYRPREVVREFAEAIRRELDLSIEAIHAGRFEVMFEGDSTVKVAKVFKEFSTKQVLTMELIEGIRVDNVEGLKRHKIDTIVLAKNGVNAFLRQVFVEGFFHADPHPGNYFALPGNVFAFIDYGMVGRLSVHDRRELASLFISFINKDSETAIEHIKHLVETSENSNWGSFEHDADDIMHQWFGAKLSEVSLAETLFSIIDSGRRNLIYFPSSLVYLAKTLFTIEAMGMRLDPNFDFSQKMGPFVKKIIKAELSPKKVEQKLMGRCHNGTKR